MYCPNCASQEFDLMTDGSGRCRYCGTTVAGMGRPAPSGIERQFNNMGDNLSTGKKDKWVAAIIAFFVGPLGIQFFYLGDMTKGVICLAITLLLGWVFGLGLLITWIWSLIFIVQIIAMSEQEFNQRFNGPKRK